MHNKNDDTIFAPATIPGTGAITVIRISGEKAIEIADGAVSFRHSPSGSLPAADSADGFGDARADGLSGGFAPGRTDPAAGHSAEKGYLSSANGYTVHFGKIFKEDGSLLDEVLVTVFRAPHSYTGENSVEISCHASSYIFNEISAILVRLGARFAEPGEFTLRAYLNGKMDLTQAEAVADLIASGSESAHRIALRQMKGGFSSELKEMRSELLETASLMELELDFSEEDVEFADRSRLVSLTGEVLAHVCRLRDSFRLGNALKNGIPVAIVGATNAGKSTLLNALLGEDRAIVSDIHGTTRDTIEEVMNIGGILFRFIDTAGLRETDESIEKMGIERSLGKLREAQIVIGVVDASRPEEEIASAIRQILSKAEPERQKVFIAFNKCDKLAGGAPDALFGGGADMASLPLSGMAAGTPADMASDAASLTLSGMAAGTEFSTASSIGFAEAGTGTAETVFNSESDASAGTGSGQWSDNAHQEAFGCSGSDIFGYSGVDARDNKNVYNANRFVSLFDYKNISTYSISASTGAGIDALKHGIFLSQRDAIADSDTTLVANLRHYEALSAAATSLSRVRDGLSSGLPSDLVAQDIREAILTLGEILGEISTDDILGEIFSKFCIGK